MKLLIVLALIGVAVASGGGYGGGNSGGGHSGGGYSKTVQSYSSGSFKYNGKYAGLCCRYFLICLYDGICVWYCTLWCLV